MAVEKPLNINEFFMSRNEIANRHGSKLELQAMARVREHMVEEAGKAPKEKATPTTTTNKKEK